ncbi:hypothetical protein PISMIDRAFT_674400 [Pisolithus microcarpus 441]|uniref:Uncharacterized protein n=1 Tax=Pisolithus microcarpus 441 TaxID=765257 RepID=A0A0C9YSZ5_9AGAM|nr:hypothetical protein BKA83DRAFT_674400 [Pisolithus microcarpus]KIK28045.1 hypothetical protein PISMIDRAFT_674400 [Pisolithus microcarpus 441]
MVAGVLGAQFPQLHPSSALCVVACLTPRDPVTCVAITRGKFAERHVPYVYKPQRPLQMMTLRTGSSAFPCTYWSTRLGLR